MSQRRSTWSAVVRSKYSSEVLTFGSKSHIVNLSSCAKLGLSVSDPEHDTEQSTIDIASSLGAEEAVSHQILTLYIPDRDRNNNEIGTQRKWVLEAADLLNRMGGGVTIMPPTEGGWYDEANNVTIWERPVLVYTYIKPWLFARFLPELREFLHRLGRETNQGEIVVEFDRDFYRITEYDASPET
jgi:hypothetical protein